MAGAGSGLAFSSRLNSASVLELPVNQGRCCVQLNESHMTSPPLRGIPAAEAVECVTGAGAELARAGWSPQDTVWQREASEEAGPTTLEVPTFGQWRIAVMTTI